MKVISNEKLNHVSGGKGKSFEGECKSKETKNKDGSTTKEWGCKVKIGQPFIDRSHPEEASLKLASSRNYQT